LRHERPVGTDQVFDANHVRQRELWYVVAVATALVLFLGTVLKQCSDEAPIPPDDISQAGQASAAVEGSGPVSAGM